MAAITPLPRSLELAATALRLRPWQPGDVDALFEAARESIASVGEWLPWCHAGYTRDDSVAWIAHCQSGWAIGEPYAFGIFDTEGRLLGSIGLNRLDRERRSANLGYWVRAQEQRKGIAPAAIQALAGFAFEMLELIRIEIVAAVDNRASRQAAERAGAFFDGISPHRIWHQGQATAAAVYSLLPADEGGESPGPVLEDGPLRLRPFHPSDLDELVGSLHESMDSIGRWQSWCTPDYTREDGRRWIARSRLAWRGVGGDCALAMVDRRSGQLIGSVTLNHWQPDCRMANLGYWVRQSRQGQGLAPMAVRMLARHALKSPELQRLEIIAAADNRASCRVAEKAGARFEGIARRRLTLRGQPQDAAMYSLVAADLA